MTPRADPPPRVGVLQRARGHLMDLTPLKVSRDFRLLFFGHSVSNFGDEIVAVAIPFQVYKITGSNFAVGLLDLITPVYAAQPFARRRLLEQRQSHQLAHARNLLAQLDESAIVVELGEFS